MPRETVKSVQLKYAYEDAIELTNDLTTAHEFALASEARDLAAAILSRWSEEGGPDAVGSLLHSVRV